jgi:hypothetical protein
VWQAVLTLVLMNPRKSKGGKKVCKVQTLCRPFDKLQPQHHRLPVMMPQYPCAPSCILVRSLQQRQRKR